MLNVNVVFVHSTNVEKNSASSIVRVSFSANMIALDGEQFPKLLTIREVLPKSLHFRCEIITRRVSFELRQVDARLHIVQGLMTIQEHVNDVIKLIREAPEASAAKQHLIDRCNLSEERASAILDMQLRRLTATESTRLTNEMHDLPNKSQDLKDILSSRDPVNKIIIDELT